MNNKFILISFLIVNTLCAQQSVIETYKEKYPESHYVRLQNHVDLKIKVNESGIEIIEETEEEDLFLTPASKRYSKGSVSFSSFNELLNVSASTYNLENGKYVEHKVKEFKKKDEMGVSFYDDIQSLNFFYPNLEVGAKKTLYTTYDVKNPRFLTSFYFGSGVPYENSKFRVEVDNDVEFEFKTFHTDKYEIDYKVKKKKSKTIHEWTLNLADPIKILGSSPSFKNYFPHIIPIIKSYKNKKGENIEVSNDIDGLYHWYNSLTEEVKNEDFDPELVKTVEAILKDKKTELEKVKAIYYWAQKNIKYVAFEYDLGGFIPRSPTDVYKKKYGDCKDNSIILYTMLKIAGIESGLTWIGTRSIPYGYSEIPTPVVDNHMILVYENKNKKYFLDATGRYMQFGLPTPFIQGKEALIGYDKDNYSIAKVPVVAADVSKQIDSIYLKIEGLNLKGIGVQLLKGYKKIEVFNILESVKEENEKLNFYRNLLSKGSNKFKLFNIKEYDKYSYDKPFKVDYDFEILDYVSAYEDELYVDLNLIPILKNQNFIKEDNVDFETDFKQSFEFYSELAIPEGYTVTYLPEDVTIKNDYLKASITYQKLDNKIIYKHNATLDYLILKKENLDFYFSELKKIIKQYKEIIVLKKQ